MGDRPAWRAVKSLAFTVLTYPRHMLLQAALNDEEQATAPWRNCTVAGAAAFAMPPGFQFLQANLVTLVSKLHLELREVWAQRGLDTCVVVDAGNIFGALRTNRCMGEVKGQHWWFGWTRPTNEVAACNVGQAGSLALHLLPLLMQHWQPYRGCSHQSAVCRRGGGPCG